MYTCANRYLLHKVRSPTLSCIHVHAHTCTMYVHVYTCTLYVCSCTCNVHSHVHMVLLVGSNPLQSGSPAGWVRIRWILESHLGSALCKYCTDSSSPSLVQSINMSMRVHECMFFGLLFFTNTNYSCFNMYMVMYRYACEY